MESVHLYIELDNAKAESKGERRQMSGKSS